MRKLALTAVGVLLGLAIIGCQTSTVTPRKPTVVVNSPPSGSSFNVGDTVSIQSTSTDAQGVTRIELQVDGVTVSTDQSPVAQGQPQFSQIQSWKAAGAGTHTIIVRAYNGAGAFSDGGISITVKDILAAVVTDTPQIATVVPPPTLAPSATLPPVPSDTAVIFTSTPTPTVTNTPAPVACIPNSQYIADTTVPDGSVVPANTGFIKTWRVLNNGTCAWDSSYSIAFVGGTAFVLGAAPIPPAAPGTAVDISLTMSAPGSFGSFIGVWRLRGPSGAFFGTNLTTQIVVPNPNPPPMTNTPTPTSTNTPLPGGPHIASFTCNPCTISPGGSSTLKYGLVSNATSASIDQGIGGITTPGQTIVSPATTTTYTLTAKGAGGTNQASVTVVVAGNFAGHWEDNFGNMDLTQNGAQVQGTYFRGTGGGTGNVSGTVTGNTLNGTWKIGIDTGSFQFTLGGVGNTFTGNWNMFFQWCGARSGVSFPSGCGFDGHWNTKYNTGTGVLCNMDLSQVGTTVTGTYCNGQIQNGTISYGAAGFVKLTGTWFISLASHGTFIFYLPAYTAQQFQGNYNGSTDWCGWRNGSSKPTPCEKN